MKVNLLHNFMQTGRLEAGCDEAGRGCLAGPVFAAAVILPADFHHPTLTDSKQLKESQRLMLRNFIETHALAYAVASVDHLEIDKINILNASILAMHRALDALSLSPDFVLVDGNRFKPYMKLPYLCVVKGDSLYASIAAASVLAKTYRDEYMTQLAEEYPHYHWEVNKAYPTASHRTAIRAYGLSPYHRRTFKQLEQQLKLF